MLKFWKKLRGENPEPPLQIEGPKTVQVVEVPVPVPSGPAVNTLEDFIVERGKKLLREHPAEDVSRWLQTVHSSFHSQSQDILH